MHPGQPPSATQGAEALSSKGPHHLRVASQLHGASWASRPCRGCSKKSKRQHERLDIQASSKGRTRESRALGAATNCWSIGASIHHAGIMAKTPCACSTSRGRYSRHAQCNRRLDALTRCRALGRKRHTRHQQHALLKKWLPKIMLSSTSGGCYSRHGQVHL